MRVAREARSFRRTDFSAGSAFFAVGWCGENGGEEIVEPPGGEAD